MPPSVHKLTPFEKRLRRIATLRALHHEPTAPNCFWTRPEDCTSGSKKRCEQCAELRARFPALNFEG
ncbi:hypothetical protein [Mycobacterium phage WXIN]|nr:hypothetical protein [Mycobacterium phage WXIN]